MADQTPGNSPLDDRLRATFSAEHADMQRRALTRDSTPTSVRGFKWIPFAVAATVIALAGFFIIGNGADDQAVDLDVAAQTTQPSPDPTQPLPDGTPGSVGEFIPYETGVQFCNNYNPTLTVVWAPGELAPVLAAPEASGVIGVTRQLQHGEGVNLIGGCTAGNTSLGDQEWYEIASADGGNPEWIRSDYLISARDYAQRAEIPVGLNNCGETSIDYRMRFAFVWGIAVDDPDGGLVAHTEVGVDAPVTRIIERDEVVPLTGRCDLTNQGSEWLEVSAPDGTYDWVSGNYLRLAVEACHGVTTSTPLPGLGVADGDRAAFAVRPELRYTLYSAERVTVGAACTATPPWEPCPTGGPLFVWDIADDDPDGGLLTHISADVDSSVVRTLAPNSALVITTGVCTQSSTGTRWWQLLGPSGIDWASGNFLAQPRQPVCLVDVAVPDPDEETFFHTVRSGDRLSTMAELYNVSIDMILAANPDMNTNLIIAGELIRIPGPSIITDQPTSGLGLQDGPRIAFAPHGTSRWVWYSSDQIVDDAECVRNPDQRRPVCLSDEIRLLDFDDPEPIWTGQGPQTGWTTKTAGSPSATHGGHDLLEVDVLDESGRRLTGFVDLVETELTDGHCILSGSDSLDEQPCTRVAGANRTAGLGTDEASRSWSTGKPDSTADHVHDLRTESNAVCTRLVVEFGNDTSGDDSPSAKLPALTVEHGLDAITVSPTTQPWTSVFEDPQRIDYDDGIGLLTLSSGYRFSVQFMHAEMEPHVRFMSDPARVVIDLFPVAGDSGGGPAAFGEKFVLRQPIQQDLTGPGIPVDNRIAVAGFGRPFEAAGLYRIWSVPDDLDLATFDPTAFLAEAPEPQFENFFATTGWAEAWGEFYVDLPDLVPGTYIAVFGELPPTDEIGFYGAGQLFRVADPSDPTDTLYPEAILLPDVQLPPES